MVFNSFAFLLLFMPVTVGLFWLSKEKYRKCLLLIFSLIFYAWGDIRALPIILLSILVNYALAFGLRKDYVYRRLVLVVLLIIDIGTLLLFKYIPHYIQALSGGNPANTLIKLQMPLGISFYTFMILSYVLDVYFETCKPEKNLINVALYVMFFPKMISGPLMKYKDFDDQIKNPNYDDNAIIDGMARFTIGLGKKVIISDVIGKMVDKAFEMDVSGIASLSSVMAWFAAICYMLQLYFDFSGYSDMAIGMGKVFGFRIDENFDYPYASTSVVEYWKRWHITLGTWVNHYIYIPTYRFVQNKWEINKHTCDKISLFVSWMIIGPWHGPGPKFLAYGIYNYILILIERQIGEYKKKLRKKNKKVWDGNSVVLKLISHLYLLVAVLFGQLFVRAETLTELLQYVRCMFGLNGNSLLTEHDWYYIRQYIVIAIIGIMASVPWKKVIGKKSYRHTGILVLKKVSLLLVLAISLALIVGNSYNAFIYFKF